MDYKSQQKSLISSGYRDFLNSALGKNAKPKSKTKTDNIEPSFEDEKKIRGEITEILNTLQK